MAPTSLPGQVTQTTPYGRDTNTAGYPVKVCEMLSTLDGVCFAQRVTVDNVKNVNIARKAIKKAFQNQIDGQGLLHCGSPVHLPHQLGPVPRGGREVAGGQHDPLLPPWVCTKTWRRA